MPYPTTKTTYTKAQLEKLLPYEVIAEVGGSPVWRDPKKKQAYVRQFSDEERDHARKIVQTAIKWKTEGLPETRALSDKGVALWRRLGAFCENLKNPVKGHTTQGSTTLGIYGIRGVF